MQHPYLNSGLPLSSTQMQPTPQQLDVPPTTVNSHFQNSQPPFPNQPLLNMNGTSPYQQNQYRRGPSQYNRPPGNQPPSPTDYPSKSHYPNLPGPSSIPGNHLNGPNSYPGQQPVPQSRIDPDMIPDVVCKLFFLEIKSIILFIITSI